MAKDKHYHDKTNYNFLLRCLATLAAAALFTAVSVALATMKYGVGVTAGIVASSVFSVSSILPIVFGGLAILFLLSCLFKGNNNGNVTTYTLDTNTGLLSNSRATLFAQPATYLVYPGGGLGQMGGVTHHGNHPGDGAGGGTIHQHR